MTTSDDIFVRNELRAGDLGRIIALHGECYAALPGFGLTFEAYVARTVAEYILDSGSRGRIWIAERDGRLVGCTAIVLRDENRGQLRWVLVDQSARGLGLGKRLVNNALQFCRENGCKEVFLETTDGLTGITSVIHCTWIRNCFESHRGTLGRHTAIDPHAIANRLGVKPG
jgi:GNAT superfamily N-acetyltransferase